MCTYKDFQKETSHLCPSNENNNSSLEVITSMYITLQEQKV